MLRRFVSIAGALATVLFLAASHAEAASDIPSAITGAVADASRPQADRDRDANRKPAATIAFAGIKSGDHVAELLPGGGYFTRIFSNIVGAQGVVYAVVPPPRPNSTRDMAAAVNAIAAEPGHKNVRVLAEPLAALSVPEPVDVVWTSLNYHDLHNAPNADLAAFNKSVLNALKPGGLYIVIDHAAEAGAGARDTSTLHRIDPATVKSEALAAGFTLEGESDVLHNAQDPHTVSVRDPSVRGKTDQFILKFRKPVK